MGMNSLAAEAADALFSARQNLRQIPPPRDTFDLATLDDAYAVQEHNTVRWLAEGRRMVGRKIGLTSKAVQAQLGVDEPDFGVLWSDYAFGDGETVDFGRFMQPRAEVEIAFVMEKAVLDPHASMTELIGAIAYALPALEIVDSAVDDWDIHLVDTVADNASGGGFALGTGPRRITGVELRLAGAVLSRNGLPVSMGLGAACLGHPLNAALWLVRKMAALGRPLAQSDTILSGALGPMVPVSAGDVYTVEIQGFAPFHLSFGR